MKYPLIGVLGAIGIAASTLADSAIVGEQTWSYSVSDGHATVTNVSPAVGELVVPLSLGGYPVTGIGNSAFRMCGELVSLTISSNVTHIAEAAFYGCGSLMSFAADENNPRFRAVDGLLCSKDGGTLMFGVNGEVAIPTNVTDIANAAFYGYGGLVSASIPTNVTRIGKRAFADTPFYDSQPDGLLVFGRIAYGIKGACPSEVFIPFDVTIIGDSAFEDRSELVAVLIPPGVTRIDDDAFDGCYGLATVYVCGKGEPDRIRALYEWPDGIEIRELAVHTCVIGESICEDVGFKGYAVQGLPPNMTFYPRSGVIGGAANAAGTYVLTFTKEGSPREMVVLEVKEEEAAVDVEAISATYFQVGLSGSVAITASSALTGVKSISVSGLPPGMKFDRATSSLVGVPSESGTFDLKVTVTTRGGTQKSFDVPLTVAAAPDMTVGTFNGFVAKANGGTPVVRGTIAFKVSNVGKMTAKVTMAGVTRSMSKLGWDSMSNGVHAAKLSTKKGGALDLAVDANAAWDENQLVGTYSVAGETYDVSACRKAFGSAWLFTATGDMTNGWTLAFAPDAQSAALSVKVKADGSTTLTGILDGVKIKAAGSVDVSGRTNGVLFVDFVQIVSVLSDGKKVKRPLNIRTNLWFDRKADHEDGVGSVKFSE